MRNLVIVLGDQLDRQSAALDGFDPAHDRLWMAEVPAESVHVWSHKARIALFLAAMRHFAADMRKRGWPVTYYQLGTHGFQTLAEALSASLRDDPPKAIVMLRAGDWRVQQAITAAAQAAGIPLEVREDRHFIASVAEFAHWAAGLQGRRKVLRLEYWYRTLRQRTGLLMEGQQPRGGRWNFDADNRHVFDKRGPQHLPAPLQFVPDAMTQATLAQIASVFADHPGSLAAFGWPVTPAQARAALEDFIAHRLPLFGRYQDAMWTGEPWLYHSRLAAALNLKLIDPLSVCRAAEAAYLAGHAPIEAVEGFMRQILGWREYVHGLYHLWMPAWLSWNALHADQPLPRFFWTGATDMACLREVISQVLATGYAHHIQRLMVTGLYCLLLGVAPREVHGWYLALFVDAVEWVELPNVLGMSQYADGGRMASKPYIASGRYIQRMSNYCVGCRYHPEQAVGARACPITTLYWDFLDRHAARFIHHPRLAQQVRNLLRKSEAERAAIRLQAQAHRAAVAV